MTTPFTDDAPRVLWEPAPDARERTRMGRYLDWLERSRGLSLPDYATAWRWSVDQPGAFWRSIVEHFEVVVHEPSEDDLADASMPGARWFPGMTLNYAENALARIGDDDVAVVARSQTRDDVTLTGRELRSAVARCADGLRRLGVERGDRVAAYLPNVPETVVAFLACASLGAVWASCAPEFGTRSVVDRLTQIDPKVLLTVEGYVYGRKRIERHEEVASIRAALPSLQHVVHVPYLPGAGPVPDAVDWDELLAGDVDAPVFAAVAFDHPLYVLYSSGTTGLPKPITHGHGGIVLEHLKAIALHGDLGPGDRFFWFSTTGWMMWNFLVSGLLVGATIVLFDGDPAFPDLDTLWQLAEEAGTTYFGVSAPFLMACRKQGLRPRDRHDLSALRGIGSTGAPLPPEGFDWVYDAVTDDALLGSISGGTDVCTAFVGPAPLLEVRAGEIPCRYLGARVEAYDPHGRPVIGEQGELVVTAPMPSMPVGFWGDDGSRYRDAYFDVYPGVWRHGDWITITERGSCVITGRSDATLNRGGVRLGTAEFYSVVEAFDEVADSLVVHLEDPTGESLGELRLFVVPADGRRLDEDALARIGGRLRAELSPRHVPDRIDVVEAVPRTLSGKKCEVPVKRILLGADPDRAVSRGALANPETIAVFERFATTGDR